MKDDKSPAVVWKDPPRQSSPRRVGAENDAVVEQLKQHPGQWALVANVSSPNGGRPWRGRGCETRLITVRDKRTGDRRFDVYARWPQQVT